MPALDRQIALRGPKFYRDGSKLMFVHHLDGSTRIGPRETVPEDPQVYAEAWAAFERDEPAEPLKPLLTFSDPEGGPPPKEIGPHARRRAEAAE